MDRDLSSLYSALRSAVFPGGSDGSFLRSIGIKTSYEDGLTTLFAGRKRPRAPEKKPGPGQGCVYQEQGKRRRQRRPDGLHPEGDGPLCGHYRRNKGHSH